MIVVLNIGRRTAKIFKVLLCGDRMLVEKKNSAVCFMASEPGPCQSKRICPFKSAMLCSAS